ncbi:MAG TPA: type I-E CRISPR-associated protein Cse1/CasA [Burkholderiaceae bacterium]|nr:type I-E CRISPR-associated protein Cse1/CasA [Burkholderiaceae bacterium]
MSLLSEAWLPVVTNNGSHKWVSVFDLADPDILAFNASRPDFNAALVQFAIGLLQTAAPLNSESGWRNWFITPPDVATLRQWFEPYAKIFEFDGDGARFMQDCTLDEKADVPIANLLIESPGKNTLDENIDHFVKRGRIKLLCPHCAVTALLTLQINAPANGRGHLTGLRGGGPLHHHYWLPTTTQLVARPMAQRARSGSVSQPMRQRHIDGRAFSIPVVGKYFGYSKKIRWHYNFPKRSSQSRVLGHASAYST